ncbi:MAG TPA: DUF1822 family protein [Candidatus Sericytochromatia bacterium]
MNQTKTMEPLTFKVTLSVEAHLRAKQLIAHTSNPQKAKQVYLNALAVYAVNFYLQCLGFETELENTDSSNPVMQTLLNVADLPVKNLGKLECIPVLPDSQSCYVPPEVWEDRIGYVAVQLHESLREATLLGFVKEVTSSKLPLSLLKPLEDLPEHIRQLKQRQPVEEQVQLSQWLHNVFDVGWETLEALFNPPQPQFRFRGPLPTITPVRKNPESGIKRGKLYSLEQVDEQVALFVKLEPISSSKINIWVEVYPGGGKTFLPEDLKLMVLDKDEKAVMQAEARSTKSIKLKFSGEVGESFGVKIALGDVSFTENFLI